MDVTRRMAGRFPGFSLRLTRWGGLYLVALLILGAAAVNTGNNALMMLFGIGLGTYVVAGTWSRQVLGRTEVHLEPPGDLHAGSAVPATVRLRTRTRIFPAAGLAVVDGEGKVVLFEPWIAAGGEVRRTVTLEPPCRGRWAVGPWRLEVLLPLGFFLKSKVVLGDAGLLVYPRLLRRQPLALGAGGREEGWARRGRGREGEARQLRPFREGDERRQLHWKQTARQQRPIVVERERPVPRPRVVAVDLELDDPEDPAQRELFEERVSRAATEVVDLLGEGVPVGLRLGRHAVPPVSGPGARRRLLAPLALVQPVARGGGGAR